MLQIDVFLILCFFDTI